MPLPHTSNSLLFWMDTSEKFINKSSSNKIKYIVNRANDNKILLENGSASPIWMNNQINGNPAISFNGTNSLYCNLAPKFSLAGFKNPFMLIVIAKIESYSPTFTLAALKNQTNNNTSQYLFGGNNGTSKIVTARSDSDGNADFGNPQIADTSYHVYNNVYDGNCVKLRIDGVEKDSMPITSATSNFIADKIVIGSTGNMMAPLNGKVAEVILYTRKHGMSLDYTPELYLKDKFKIR